MNRLLPFLLCALSASACVVTTGGRDRDERLATEATTASDAPRVPASNNVAVDNDRTMNVVGGAGVGVFVEYKTGGSWQVSMSCDTAISSQPCAFQVKVTGAALSELTLSDVPPSDVTSNATTLLLSSDVRLNIPVMSFRSTPGAPITVQAASGAVSDPAMFFFVSGGAVRGGDSRAVVNPLTFTPASP